MFPVLTLAFIELKSQRKNPIIWASLILFLGVIIWLYIAQRVYQRIMSQNPYRFEARVRHVCLEKAGPRWLPGFRFKFLDKDPGPGKFTLFRLPVPKVHGDGPAITLNEPTFHGFCGRFRGRSTWAFYIPLGIYELLRAAIYGLCQEHGLTQVILLLAVELFHLGGQLYVKPYGSDRYVLILRPR